MSSYEKLELIFGKGCDPMKIADAVTGGIEDYEVNGETGETLTVWDWIEEGVPV